MRAQDYLAKISTSGQHLLSLINDVLDMSHIESGHVKIEEKEVHLPDVMHDLRTIVNANIVSKNIEFSSTRWMWTTKISSATSCDSIRCS